LLPSNHNKLSAFFYPIKFKFLKEGVFAIEIPTTNSLAICFIFTFAIAAES
jgi:hypothetical protein